MANNWLPLNNEENRKYLEEHHLHVYFEDAISQLLSLRQENSKIKHVKFFREYFRSVQQGSHVLFRDYEFISATPHNRACVIECFWRTYKTMHYNGERLSLKDCHSVLQLLWPDFPENIIQLTVRIIIRNGSTPKYIPFKEFLYGFQLQFCFEEFLQIAKEIFEDMISLEREEKSKEVDTINFLSKLKENFNKEKQKTSFYPTPQILDKFMDCPNFKSFKEFQRALLIHEDITRLVGKLPLPSLIERADSKIPIGTISRPRPVSCLGHASHLSSSLHSLPVKLTDSDVKTSAMRSKSATHINKRLSSTRHHSQ